MTRHTAFDRLQPFDRRKQFRVKVAKKISGKRYNPGDVLDKTALTTRRLRQLYENRVLVMIKEPDFQKMDYDQLVDWISSRGKKPRYGADRQKLVNLASSITNGST